MTATANSYFIILPFLQEKPNELMNHLKQEYHLKILILRIGKCRNALRGKLTSFPLNAQVH